LLLASACPHVLFRRYTAGVTHISIESHARSIDACLAEIELFGTFLAD